MCSRLSCSEYSHLFQAAGVYRVCVCVYLEVRHLGVALLRASVVGQLNVPETRQLVHQDWVLLDEGIEDVLHASHHVTSHHITHLLPILRKRA